MHNNNHLRVLVDAILHICFCDSVYLYSGSLYDDIEELLNNGLFRCQSDLVLKVIDDGMKIYDLFIAAVDINP